MFGKVKNHLIRTCNGKSQTVWPTMKYATLKKRKADQSDDEKASKRPALVNITNGREQEAQKLFLQSLKDVFEPVNPTKFLLLSQLQYQVLIKFFNFLGT